MPRISVYDIEAAISHIGEILERSQLDQKRINPTTIKPLLYLVQENLSDSSPSDTKSFEYRIMNMHFEYKKSYLSALIENPQSITASDVKNFLIYIGSRNTSLPENLKEKIEELKKKNEWRNHL